MDQCDDQALSAVAIQVLGTDPGKADGQPNHINYLIYLAQIELTGTDKNSKYDDVGKRNHVRILDRTRIPTSVCNTSQIAASKLSLEVLA